MQLGANSAGLNGFQLERNKLYKAYPGDILGILHEKHFHAIEIDVKLPASKNIEDTTSQTVHKRKSSQPPEPTDDKNAEIKKIKLDPIKGEPAMCSSWESLHSKQLMVYTSKDLCDSSKVFNTDNI